MSATFCAHVTWRGILRATAFKTLVFRPAWDTQAGFSCGHNQARQRLLLSLDYSLQLQGCHSWCGGGWHRALRSFSYCFGKVLTLHLASFFLIGFLRLCCLLFFRATHTFRLLFTRLSPGKLSLGPIKRSSKRPGLRLRAWINSESARKRSWRAFMQLVELKKEMEDMIDDYMDSKDFKVLMDHDDVLYPSSVF